MNLEVLGWRQWDEKGSKISKMRRQEVAGRASQSFQRGAACMGEGCGAEPGRGAAREGLWVHTLEFGPYPVDRQNHVSAHTCYICVK